MVKLRLQQDGDGWLVAVPGWEQYRVRIVVGIVDGAPRVTALSIEPLNGGEPVALTSARIRTLPLTDAAILAANATHTGPGVGELRAAIRRVGKQPGAKHDPRAVASVDQVAAVWHAARAAGKPTQAAIRSAFPELRPRTVDLYVRRAREAGLIPPTEGRKRGPRPTETPDADRRPGD